MQVVDAEPRIQQVAFGWYWNRQRVYAPSGLNGGSEAHALTRKNNK